MVELILILTLSNAFGQTSPSTTIPDNHVVFMDRGPSRDTPSALNSATSLLNTYLSKGGIVLWEGPVVKAPFAKAQLISSGINSIIRLDTNQDLKADAWTFHWETAGAATKTFRILKKDSSPKLIAQEIARRIFTELGRTKKQIQALFSHVATIPSFIYDQLSEGDVYLRQSLARKAEFRFERVLSLRKLGMIPQGLEGLMAARVLGKRLDRELAESAAQRAVVQERQRQYEKAYKSWISFLEYTPHRAQAFARNFPLGRGPVKYFNLDTKLWVQNDDFLIELDKENGALNSQRASIPNLVAIYSGSYLIRSKQRLQRVEIDSGKILWSTPLSPGLKGTQLGHSLSSGFLALFSSEYVQWFDLTSGEALQKATQIKVLDGGTTGILFQRTNKGALELGLLRPGRGKPSWTIPLESAPSIVAQVRGRILLTYGSTLRVLDARNGKQRGKDVELGYKAPRLLAVEGRYAAFADAKTVTLVDVLASIKTAKVEGPGKPKHAGLQPEGLIVIYDTQDVLYFDRDGEMKERTRIEGETLGVVRGHPKTPSNLLITSLGVIAKGDLPSDNSYRDLDAYLAMARLLTLQKEPGFALEWLEHLATRSLGQIAAIEIERCRLLKNAARIQAAHQRAYSANDPKQSVRRFRALD